jgi:hypothetical protein
MTQHIPQTETNNMSFTASLAKFQNALAFVDKVRETYKETPVIYSTFLSIMKRYKSRRISREVAVECVTKLFEGHDDLLVEFNSFLPPQLRRNVNTENSPNLVEEQFGEIFDKLIENPTKEIGKKFLAHFQKLDQVTFHVFKIWLFEDESRRETFLNLLDTCDISIIYCVIYCFKSLIVTPPFFNRKRFLENTLTTTIKSLFETKLIPKLIRVLSSHYDIPEIESSIVEMLIYYFNSATNNNSKRQKRKNTEHSPCCENFGRFFSTIRYSSRCFSSCRR